MRERASFNLKRICGDSGLVEEIYQAIALRFVEKRMADPQILGLTVAQLAELFSENELRSAIFTTQEPTRGQVRALAGRLSNILARPVIGRLTREYVGKTPCYRPRPRHLYLSESEYRAAVVYRNDGNKLSQVRQRLKDFEHQNKEIQKEIKLIEEWIETETRRHDEDHSGETAFRVLEAFERGSR